MLRQWKTYVAFQFGFSKLYKLNQKGVKTTSTAAAIKTSSRINFALRFILVFRDYILTTPAKLQQSVYNYMVLDGFKKMKTDN